jgi:predicted dehydrogenase
MDKLKVIQIGIGHDHGTSGFNSILRQPDVFDVVGFAVPEEELESGKWEDQISEYRDQRKIPYYSVEEILNLPNVEAALIECEDLFLTKYALLAIKKGLHVYMDKPGSPNLEEFEELVSIAKEKKLTFSVGYMYRFNPMIMEAKRRIDNGEIGEIYCVEADIDCEHTTAKKNWLENFPGGMMYFLGCHLVDLLNIFQGEPEEVLPLNCSTGIDGVKALDYGMAVYKYKNGVSFVKSCASECGGYMRRQLVICGSKGTIEFRPLETFDENAPRDYLYTEMRVTGKDMGWQHFEPKVRSEYFNRFDAMLKCFADVAKGRIENPYPYEHELSTYKLLLKSCGVEI